MGWLVRTAAIVGGAMLLRKYLGSRPVRFSFEGEDYVRLPDGGFTGPGGAPVISPQLERVKAHWDNGQNKLGGG